MVKRTSILILLIVSITSYSQCKILKYDTVGCDRVTMDIEKFAYYYKCEKNLSLIKDTLVALKKNTEEIKRLKAKEDSLINSLIEDKNKVIKIQKDEISYLKEERKGLIKKKIAFPIIGILSILILITNL